MTAATSTLTPAAGFPTLGSHQSRLVRRLDVAALWLAYVLVLAASVVHVARAFSSLERPGEAWAGWLAALGLDLGLAVLARSAALAGARQLQVAGRLRLGLVIFAGLSALANLDHALAVLAPAGAPDPWAAWAAASTYGRLRLVLLSASLPLLVVLLAHAAEALARVDLGAPQEALVATGRAADDLDGGRGRTARRTAQEPLGGPIAADASPAATARRESLLALLRAEPDLSARALASRLGAHRTTVTADLSLLTGAGALSRDAGRWVVLAPAPNR